MKDLAGILAKLYPDRDKVRFILFKVGIDPDQINLDGDAILRWERVLNEAWKHDKVPKTVEVASQDYNARSAELATAMQAYLDSRNWQVGRETVIPVPPWAALPSNRYNFEALCEIEWVIEF